MGDVHMRWIFFRDVFGGWRWERLDDAGATIGESSHSFDSREAAEIDAGLHGYAPYGSAAGPSELAQSNEKR